MFPIIICSPIPLLKESPLLPQSKCYPEEVSFCCFCETTVASEPSSAQRSIPACSSVPPCALSPERHHQGFGENVEKTSLTEELQNGRRAPAHHLGQVVLLVQEGLPCDGQHVKLLKLLLDLGVQLCCQRFVSVLPEVHCSI